MCKIKLTLKEHKNSLAFGRVFSVESDAYTRKVVQMYINKVDSHIKSKNNMIWDLEKYILKKTTFAVIFTSKEDYLESIQEVTQILQKFADEQEKIKNYTYSKEKNKNLDKSLKSKEKENNFTGYSVKLDLSKVENIVRNLIEEYITELNKPKYTQDVDFVKILDSIKEAINNKNITVVDCMAFVSDLNDYLTDLVAGIYNA